MKTTRSRKFYFYAFSLLTLLIIMIIAFFYYSRKDVILRERHIELSAIADEKIKQITTWRNEKFSDAAAITNDGIFSGTIDKYIKHKDPNDSMHIYNWITGFSREKDYASISILDTAFNCIACMEKIHIPDSMLLRNIIDSGKPHFSDFFLKGDRSVYIDVYAPLILKEQDTRKPLGILVLRIDPESYIFRVVQNWPTPSRTSEILLYRVEQDSVVYINILRHAQNKPLMKKYPLSAKDLPASMGGRGFRGITEGIDYRGIPVLADIRKVPDSPWLTVTKIDIDEIYAPLNNLLLYSVISGIIMIAATALLLGYLWRTQNAALFKKLYSSELERQALLKNFEYLTKYANDIILLLDDKGNISYANEKTEHQYGYTSDELLTMNIGDLRADRNNPDTSSIFSNTKAQGGLVYEALHRRRDGSVFNIEASSRFMNIDGVDYFQTIIRDISDKKLAEEKLKGALREKEILLKEIHHRVKNNLQIISSLLNLHSNLNQDEKLIRILTESQSRINSIALIHQLLYSENISAVNSVSYFTNLLENLVRTFGPDKYNINTISNVDEAMLKMDTVIPLGLILTEILSNIFKHAFPDNRSGTIRVEFTKDNENKYLLKISDDGVGLPQGFDYMTSPTLGMQLIHILTEQIDGTIRIHNGRGTEYEISFKE